MSWQSSGFYNDRGQVSNLTLLLASLNGSKPAVEVQVTAVRTEHTFFDLFPSHRYRVSVGDSDFQPVEFTTAGKNYNVHVVRETLRGTAELPLADTSRGENSSVQIG